MRHAVVRDLSCNCEPCPGVMRTLLATLLLGSRPSGHCPLRGPIYCCCAITMYCMTRFHSCAVRCFDSVGSAGADHSVFRRLQQLYRRRRARSVQMGGLQSTVGTILHGFASKAEPGAVRVRRRCGARSLSRAVLSGGQDAIGPGSWCSQRWAVP